LQEVLGQECISLEFRHLASYLLWYCQSHNVTDLLHLTIVLVGYFAAKNTDNQVPVGSFFGGNTSFVDLRTIFLHGIIPYSIIDAPACWLTGA
jgi:hypothetical protein